MKIIYYLFLALVLFVNEPMSAQAPNYLWAQKSGSVNGISIAAVAVDASGNSYIAGKFSRTVTIAGTLLDSGSGSGMFIAKYSASGVGLWAKKAVGNDSILPQAIAIDANGDIYVAGAFYAATFTMNSVTLTNSDSSTTFADEFLLKFNSNGTALWGNRYFSSNFGNDYIFDIAIDTNGYVVVAGCNHDTVTNSRNITLLKLTSGGSFWGYKNISGTVTDQADNVSVDASGNIYVSGKYNSPSLSFGTSTITNSGGYDMFLAKYDSGMTLLWVKSVANTNDVSGVGMDLDAAGNLYLMGYFNSPSLTFGTTVLNNPGSGLYSHFITKYDPDGNVVWAVKPNGGSTNISRGNIVVDAVGNSFITGGYTAASLVFGSTTLTNVGGLDIFLARYTSSGNAVWAKTIGGSGDDYSADVTLAPNGNCILAGNFLSYSLTFGSTVLVNQGNTDLDTDYFLTRLDNPSLAMGQFSKGVDALKIFPNPVQNGFEITTDMPVQKVEIYSMLGQLVKSFQAQNQYDVSDLPQGNYLVKITSTAATASKIILVK